MKIGIVGLGYVGLVTAGVLANKDNEVIGVDIERNKIQNLKKGIVPIFEPGLENLINSSGNRLNFSDNFSDLKGCEAIFICVPTPNNKEGIDLTYVLDASIKVSSVTKDSILIIKSTVTPGTARSVKKNTGMSVLSNPEFTREGSAVNDTEKPDRIVIGGEPADICENIWKFTGSKIIKTTNENAELIKYASNAFLATKISFINQMADLCETIPGADVNVVAMGMGMDRRIGSEFLKAGLGYGGSCFPKDTKALFSFSLKRDVNLSIIESVISYNESRIRLLVEKITDNVGTLKGKRICILGLSFKDNTDDLRESRSISLAQELLRSGALLKGFDPVVKNSGLIEICNNIDECISSSEIIITATEWNVFKDLTKEQLAGKKVFDFRRILNLDSSDLTMGVGIGKN
jgi:UDPglucose 6-dehydrogenase